VICYLLPGKAAAAAAAQRKGAPPEINGTSLLFRLLPIPKMFAV
jgi:hypothetical protein